MLLTELVAKQLEILKEVLPRMTRICVLFTSIAPSYGPTVHALQAAGTTLAAPGSSSYPGPPRKSSKKHSQQDGSRTGRWICRCCDAAHPLAPCDRLAELAREHRLPASMFGTRENVEAGGFMSYAPDLRDIGFGSLGNVHR